MIVAIQHNRHAFWKSSMIYHHIALNSILSLLTYAHHEILPKGARVVVTLNGKKQVGMVWASDITPDCDPKKILSIVEVLSDDFRLPENWLNLVSFASRYYYYPLGQTVFAALPQQLKETKAIRLPEKHRWFMLNEEGKTKAKPPQHHSKKWALWQALSSDYHDLAALKAIHPQAKTLLDTYEKNQWLNIKHDSTPRFHASNCVLNAEQQSAAKAVQESSHRYQSFLLHGITGSGKTEVYFEMMANTLALGKQVLFLLPEINLTPQLLSRIHQRFANISLAVLHSQTPAAQRSRDYLRALNNDVQLIIGTRLSVFTPMANLGLIVVDEEHDSSFKQDSDLRYHARDLAIWRAHQVNCPIVLGSATPSLETWQKAQDGRHQLLSLTQRAHQNAKLPEIHLLDIRHLTLNNGLSQPVIELLKENQKKGGLSLVYLNRRGFAPALFCSECGHTFHCPNCSAKMVLHQRAKQLRCHHCDFRQPIARTCPDCGNPDLTALGQGTQRIEETLRALLPEANIARVDRDSVHKKDDWNRVYQDIQDGKIDVLVGTQMLAKGHDFARLNLVVVIQADNALFSSDFRAPEHLFAELMQVSGRAGRHQLQGRVVIQTRLPEHALFQAIVAQNYAQFAQQELQERQVFSLPPFSFQAAIRADAPLMQHAFDFLNKHREIIAPMLPEKVQQTAVVPMLMSRLAGRERVQIFLESTHRKALHQALNLWWQTLNTERHSSIRWHIDVDVEEM